MKTEFEKVLRYVLEDKKLSNRDQVQLKLILSLLSDHDENSIIALFNIFAKTLDQDHVFTDLNEIAEFLYAHTSLHDINQVGNTLRKLSIL